MGNKPDSTPWGTFLAGSFTERIAMHPRVAFYPYPELAPCHVLVPFIVDELLIGKDVLANPALHTVLAAACDPVGVVFDDVPPQGQVEIWRLRNVTNGLPFPDVAAFVWGFRSGPMAGTGIDPAQVAPNHVLVPAPNFHECPGGPPRPHDPVAVPPTPGDGPPFVCVIDSGWAPDGPAMGFVGDFEYAKWFDADATGKSKWVEPAPTPTLTDGNELLALAGHANFIAGVIAQACANARIVVESHSAAFLEANESDPAIPTEASIARSLWNAARHDSSRRRFDVLHVGFAFPTLPNIPLTAADTAQTPASWALKVVLDSLDARPPYIVSPAGNQGCTIPQYPAAFWAHGYDNVIGVGSVHGPTRSAFSNHGPWVRCATEGEDVVSTFMGITATTEDDPGKGEQTFDGFAVWDGTSFSAAKVTGALAAAWSKSDPWASLSATATSGLDVGVLLPGLTPAPVAAPVP
jgi:Subtilase family